VLSWLPKLVTNSELHYLEIVIVRAENLHNAGLFDKADPYVAISIEDKRHSEIDGPVAWNKQNPIWNFTINLYAWEKGDAVTFEVYDKDVGGPLDADDFLGWSELDSGDLDPLFTNQSCEAELELEDGDGVLFVTVTKRCHSA